MVEPFLRRLPKAILDEIMILVLLAPGEVEESIRAEYANHEFEEPSPSL